MFTGISKDRIAFIYRVASTRFHGVMSQKQVFLRCLYVREMKVSVWGEGVNLINVLRITGFEDFVHRPEF
jgi:hypothetical protein